MKKLLTLLSAVVISGSIMAQKPSSDDSKYSLEGMINYSDAGFEWNAPNLRMRYFINDNIAARVTIGLGLGSESSNYYETGQDATGVGTVDASSTNWSIGLGGEYHLSGTDRLSPYFSAGLMFGGMSDKIVGTDVDEVSDPIDDALYEAGSSHENNTSSSMFGLGLSAGMDYYVFDNIYLGLELGFNWVSYTDNGGSNSSTAGGTTLETTFESAGSQSGMSLSGGNMGFRIGWRF